MRPQVVCPHQVACAVPGATLEVRRALQTPAKHPRVMTVVDEEMAQWMRRRSKAEGRSVSLVVREILGLSEQ